MKKMYMMVVVALAASLVGCVQSRNVRPADVAALPVLDAQDGQKVSVSGAFAEDSVPTLILTSHRVGNGRNIVRLERAGAEPTISFVPGMAVHVSGVLLSRNRKVPVIVIESFEEKKGPNKPRTLTDRGSEP